MRSRREFARGLSAAVLAFPAVLTAKKEWTTLRVVVQDEKGRPVPRAAVIVRELKGKQLKKVGPPSSSRRASKAARRFRRCRADTSWCKSSAKDSRPTESGRVELSELEQTLTIKLEPPQAQHSIHKK